MQPKNLLDSIYMRICDELNTDKYSTTLLPYLQCLGQTQHVTSLNVLHLQLEVVMLHQTNLLYLDMWIPCEQQGTNSTQTRFISPVATMKITWLFTLSSSYIMNNACLFMSIIPFEQSVIYRTIQYIHRIRQFTGFHRNSQWILTFVLLRVSQHAWCKQFWPNIQWINVHQPQWCIWCGCHVNKLIFSF